MAMLQVVCTLALVALVAGATSEDRAAAAGSSWEKLARDLLDSGKGYYKTVVDEFGNALTVAVGRTANGGAVSAFSSSVSNGQAPKKLEYTYQQ